jgi:hypothetical protein
MAGPCSSTVVIEGYPLIDEGYPLIDDSAVAAGRNARSS